MLFRQRPQVSGVGDHMMNFNFIESSAGRIAARIQSIGGSFDPEVLSLPGGSIIAILLWLYAASTVAALHRDPPQPRPVEPIVACSDCVGHD
jgi:hypothetical protein